VAQDTRIFSRQYQIIQLRMESAYLNTMLVNRQTALDFTVSLLA
jgi:hypothetical protein